MCSIDNCNLEIFDGKDKCILHCKKDDWCDDVGTWDNQKIKDFWERIHLFLKEKYQEHNGQDYILIGFIQFEDIVFPKFQDDTIDYFDFDPHAESGNFYFIKVIPEEDRNRHYDGSQDVCTDIENLKIKFKNCIFLEKADFLKYSFKKFVFFNNCTFKNEVLLNDKFISPVVFNNGCNFNNCTLDLSNKIFKAQLNIVDCENIGDLKCFNTNFNIVSFRNSIINNTNFTNASFNEKSSFIDTKFKNKTDFSHTTFNKICSFRKSVFTKKLDLTDTVFKDNVNFLNIKTNELNRETARIIKDSFEKQNNIIDANRFYALEMKEMEKELNPLKNIFEWLIFKFHKISSDHSQDWLMSLFWIMNIAFLYGYIDLKKMGIIQVLDKMFILVIVGVLISYIYKRYRGWFAIPITFLFYNLYISSPIVNDSNLDKFAKNINPFSIMKGSDPITFDELVFKIIIAYLIYQLIVSIRQNTRRK